MNFNLNNCENIFILGAGHGIGLGLVRTALEENKEVHVYATYRNKAAAEELIQLAEQVSRLSIYQVDPTQESELRELSKNLMFSDKLFHLMINCVGVLNDSQVFPEKSLKDISMDNLLHSFKVNTVVAALFAKTFEKLFSFSNQTMLINISAKVGSIEDNGMGGWYGYRSSKAALNMITKNVAIEFSRKKKNCIVLAIHPGTTHTSLSEDYIKNTKYKIHTPLETARNILGVAKGKTVEDSGEFYSWNGEKIPW